MIAKIAVILGVVAVAQAGGLSGSSSLGYTGDIGYGAYGHGSGYYGVTPYTAPIVPIPAYTAPIVKAVAPVAYTPIVKTVVPVSYTAPVYSPAVSSVSQYSIHQAPVLKSYAPIAYPSFGSPYLSHAHSAYGSYDGYGYGGYGSKYAW